MQTYSIATKYWHVLVSSINLKCFVVVVWNGESLHLLIEVKVCKTLEDLLQRRLTDRILVDVEDRLQIVNHSKHLANCLVLVRDSQFHIVPILFYHFDFSRIFWRVFFRLVKLSDPLIECLLTWFPYLADSFDGSEHVPCGEKFFCKDGSCAAVSSFCSHILVVYLRIRLFQSSYL